MAVKLIITDIVIKNVSLSLIIILLSALINNPTIPKKYIKDIIITFIFPMYPYLNVNRRVIAIDKINASNMNNSLTQ